MWTDIQNSFTKWFVRKLSMYMANVDRYSQLFHQVIRKEMLYVHITKISTSHATCFTLPCESRKSKKNVAIFSRWTWPVVKVRGNAGERRSWAPKKCQLAFLGPTQPKFQGECKGERSSWAPNDAGQRSPALHNRWPVTVEKSLNLQV